LTKARVRCGYFRICILLRRDDWMVNHKRVYRLYREDGLSVRLKRPAGMSGRQPAAPAGGNQAEGLCSAL
jgi:putative transposase